MRSSRSISKKHATELKRPMRLSTKAKPGAITRRSDHHQGCFRDRWNAYRQRLSTICQPHPHDDAPPVARLRQAGAIILGKTNLPTLASGIQSNNPVFGRTNNPWDRERTPGGSSGGAAAAISAGLSTLELGSDIGGSIRIPSHFCGVYGLKASGGRVIGKGHLASPKQLLLPPGWEPLLQLASIGPIARSIDDLRLSFIHHRRADDTPLGACRETINFGPAISPGRMTSEAYP